MKSKTRLTLDQAIVGFLEAERRSGKAALTLVNYRADLSALLRSIGERTFVSGLAKPIRRHLDELQIAQRSWNRHLTTLRRFCQFMVEQQAMQRNPLRMVERAPVTALSAVPASAAQVITVVDRADNPRDQVLLALLWDCGLRIREALELRIRDVELNSGTILIRGATRRRLRLTPHVKLLLERYLMQRNASAAEPLFTSYGVRQLSYAGAHRLFRRYAGTSGLTMRRLRASAAVAAFDRGASLSQVQTMLGHLHAASTARYRADADLHGLQTKKVSRKTFQQPNLKKQ